MKKIYSILLAVAATLSITTSCSDVPMPYDIFGNGETSFGKKLPYKSTTMNTGWSTYKLTDYDPWSQGSSYTQATGYQKWDGADTKSNKQVEGYLVSPAINTTAASGKVKITFDHCIAYSNKDADFKNHVGLYVSKNYDGSDFKAAKWDKIDFAITDAACNTSWTLVNVGEIQLPDSLVNVDGVYFAFYFKSVSAEASITWEPMNFYVMEGVADSTGTTTPTDSTTTTAAGTKDAPLSVADAKTKSGSMAYVTGYIVGYVDGTTLSSGAKFEAASASETEILIADAADCKDATLVLPVQLPVGDLRTKLNPSIASNIGKQVVVYGSLENYFGTTGMKSTSWAKFEGAEIGKDPDAPVVPAGEAKGDGTASNPYNVSAITAYTSALAADTNSDKEVYFEGIICNDPSIDTGSYGNASFKISDDGTDNNSFYVFRTFDIGGNKFTASDKVKKGDKVVIYGTVVNYKGNTPETAGNKSHIISINGSTEGGSSSDDKKDDTPSGSSDALSISGTTVTLTNSAVTAGTTTVTVDINTLGFENAAEVNEISFSDGTKLTLAAGSNANGPKFYTATKGLRVYANNTLTFEGVSNIAKIEMTCDSYNGTDYVGNATATVTFDGKKAVYTNASTTAGTQLRVQTITITYAK